MNGFCVGCSTPPGGSGVAPATAPARRGRAGRKAVVPPAAGERPRRARTAALDDPGLVGLAGRGGGEVGDDERAATGAGDDDRALGADERDATERLVGAVEPVVERDVPD